MQLKHGGAAVRLHMGQTRVLAWNTHHEIQVQAHQLKKGRINSLLISLNGILGSIVTMTWTVTVSPLASLLSLVSPQNQMDNTRLSSIIIVVNQYTNLCNQSARRVTFSIHSLTHTGSRLFTLLP